MRKPGSELRTEIHASWRVFLILPLLWSVTGLEIVQGGMGVAGPSGLVWIPDETPNQKAATETSVTVRCRGRLRHGLAAIGGETTGTTLTFHRTVWELNLPDDAARQLADQMNKEVMVVTGSLRRVIATEDHVRWIVDVEKLSPPGPQDLAEEGAEITVKGTLRARLATSGDIPDMSVRTEDQIWHLDFGTDRRLLTSVEPMIGQLVLLTGRVLPPPKDAQLQMEKPDAPSRHIIQVKQVQSAAQ